MYCIAGLGNPGEEYTGTRHNIGFSVVDRVGGGADTHIRRQEYLALTGESEIGRTKVFLMKPQTYMNASGASVAQACRNLGIGADRLIVAYDDLDLPLGRIRVRPGGSSGGHNGIESIAAELGGYEFPRVRCGIGRPEPGVEVIEYVLSRFLPEDSAVVQREVSLAAAAVAEVVCRGVDAAMQKYNRLDARREIADMASARA